jgi:hypothetical protein
MGLCNVLMPVLYSVGQPNALRRLIEEVQRISPIKPSNNKSYAQVCINFLDENFGFIVAITVGLFVWFGFSSFLSIIQLIVKEFLYALLILAFLSFIWRLLEAKLKDVKELTS